MSVVRQAKGISEKVRYVQIVFSRQGEFWGDTWRQKGKLVVRHGFLQFDGRGEIDD